MWAQKPELTNRSKGLGRNRDRVLNRQFLEMGMRMALKSMSNCLVFMMRELHIIIPHYKGNHTEVSFITQCIGSV